MFACIYIPDFPAEAVVRTQPFLREQAIALLEGKPPLARVIALNENARHLGMEIGMTKLEAAIFSGSGKHTPAAIEEKTATPKKKASTRIEFSSRQKIVKPLVKSATLCNRSLQQEKSAHSALLDVAHSFSPWVEDTSDDTVLLDLSGLERLYGAHARMARELSARTTAIGLESNIAIAANPDAARHAARGFTGITVIPDGKEAQRLAVLPIPILLEGFASAPKQTTQKSARDHEKRCEQILDTLERWGVREFRTLALLPEHALMSRLGETGIALHRLARGAATRTLALCQPAFVFEETQELDSPVETLEPLSFILNRLLQQLCARLEARALAVQELRLELQLERRIADEENLSANELAATLAPHNVAGVPLVRRTLQLPVAMRDPKVFLKLLQLDLDAHPPGAPVILLRVIAEPAPPRTAQCGLFLPVSPEAEKLEITLARIGGIVGERRVGIARLLDTRRREGFSMSRFVAAENSPTAPAMPDTSNPPPMAMRMFRPPQKLSVQTAEQKPATVTPAENFRERNMVQGKVVWSAGPWRSSGDWWTEKAKPNADENVAAPFDREEWDIALSHPGNTGIALYRIYRDLGSGSWFADARYD